MEFLKIHGLKCVSIQFVEYMDGKPRTLEIAYEDDVTGVAVNIRMAASNIPLKSLKLIEAAANNYTVLTLNTVE